MTWGAVGAAAIGTIGGAMLSKGGGGGGGTQTVDKTPWAAAQPWLTSNLAQGQSLQKAYQDNPFNPVQKASFGNLLQGNDYINQMVPGLLSQMSQPTGFDRNNPRARPAPFSFPGMNAANYQPTAGLLGQSLQGAQQAAPAPQQGAAPAGYVQGLFGTVPAPAQIPGTTSPAPLPTTWGEWLQGLNNQGSN